MQAYYRPAQARGHARHGWLDSHHTFSFASYHDPAHQGLSVLRVINDDTVAPGAGFGTHGHRDMEIISYVLAGSIAHKDSLGNNFKITEGEVQRMSAGSGISHSEYNASSTRPLKFLQIWIEPNRHGIAPTYEQKYIVQQGALTPLVTADGRAGSISLQQDANLYRLVLAAGETHQLTARTGYLHVIQGGATTERYQLRAGDGWAPRRPYPSPPAPLA